MVNVVVSGSGHVGAQAGFVEQPLQRLHVAFRGVDDEGGAVVARQEKAVAADAVEMLAEAVAAAGHGIGAGPVGAGSRGDGRLGAHEGE